MTACGIDFGTSNSAVGIIKKNQPHLVPLENGKFDIPTALFFNFEEDETTYGRLSIEDYIDGENGRFMRSLKSVLGTPLMHDKTQIKTKKYSFIEIISIYLKELKKRSENHTNTELINVVMGRPVHFIDGDNTHDKEAENALCKAANLAGFKNVEFEFEPIAAAYAYEATVNSEELALIIDIGGGTSDFSIVKVSKDNHKRTDRKNDVLATSGVHIGGTDFDREISLKTIMPLFGLGQTYLDNEGLNVAVMNYFDFASWHRIHLLYDKEILFALKNLLMRVKEPETIKRFINAIEQRDLHRVAIEVEKSKILLAENNNASIDLSFVEENLKSDISEETFIELSNPLCQSIEKAMQECLTDANVKIEDISTIFLTGGTMSIQNLQQLLLKSFKNAKIVMGDQFGSIGLGLGIKSQKIFM